MGREPVRLSEPVALREGSPPLKHDRRQPSARAAKIDRGRQVAALPVRTEADGSLHVLLVTSRDTGRWVLPKGWPIKGLDEPGAAAREAFEEGGVVGDVDSETLGVYGYIKRLADASAVAVMVAVYRLDVRQELTVWPERHERRRRWFSPSDAALLVDEPELREILAGLGA